MGRALDDTTAQIDRVTTDLLRVRTTGPEADIVRYEKLLRDLTRVRAELTGELTRIDESRLAQSPRFQRFCLAICEALRPHPDALTAVLDVMRRTSDEDRGAR